MSMVLTARIVSSAWEKWVRDEASSIGYIAKVLFAVVVAMGVSLIFDFDQPRTAMMTVAIVMHAHSGMVLAKSYYRFIGTVAGIVVSIVLVALFVQDRIPFLICMAIWIGICTSGSVILRNHQSYSFVLAGYTLCIVGLPATLQPDQTFDIAMGRISEILVGLLCATVVSDLIFPKRIGSVMLESVRRRFADFSAILISASSGNAEYRPALMRLMSDIFSLESFRASSVLESDASRNHRLRLGRLNADFMEVSTTFHSIEEVIRRQRKSGMDSTANALSRIYSLLGNSLAINGRTANSEIEAAEIAARISNFRSKLEEIISSERLNADSDKIHFDAGVELLRRLARELQAYASTYAQSPRRENNLDTPSLGIRFDPLAVALAGFRGAIMLFMMASIWIFTEWGFGIEAITFGVVSSTLFASSPSPQQTIRQFFMGAMGGAVLAYWTNFHLLNHAQGFPMLVLAITPGIAIAAWLTTKPDRAVIGGGFFIIFIMHLAIGTSYNGNPAGFMNSIMADLIAILFSGVLYSLIDLSGSRWLRIRTASSLRRLVVDACQDSMPLRREKFEISARDLVHRSGSLRRIADDVDKLVVDWLLSSLEIGHLVILLREQIMDADHLEFPAVSHAIHAVANLFDSPARVRLDLAIRSLDEALVSIATHDGSRFRQIELNLYLLKCALMDENSVIGREMGN